MAQQAVCAQPQVQQGSTPKAPGEAAEEARRRQGTGKYSDKPGKSVVTSHYEPRQTYRGRRKTTTLPLNGRLHRKRNHLQWKPSFAIKSDKKGTNDPKG